MDMERFTSAVVSIVVSLIIVIGVAIPIVGSTAVPDTVANHAAIQSLVDIVPLLMVVGVVLACVGMFLYKKSRN